MTRYLLGFATGVAIGVYIGLRLVWAGEPPVDDAWYRFDGTRDDGTRYDDWSTDPHLTTLTEGGKHP